MASPGPSGDWAASGRAVTPTRNVHNTLPSALKQSSSLTSNSRIQREISGTLPDGSTPALQLQNPAAGSRRANTPTRCRSAGMEYLDDFTMRLWFINADSFLQDRESRTIDYWTLTVRCEDVFACRFASPVLRRGRGAPPAPPAQQASHQEVRTDPSPSLPLLPLLPLITNLHKFISLRSVYGVATPNARNQGDACWWLGRGSMFGTS